MKVTAKAVRDKVVIKVDLKRMSQQGVLILSESEAYRLMLSLFEEHNAARTFGEHLDGKRVDGRPA